MARVLVLSLCLATGFAFQVPEETRDGLYLTQADALVAQLAERLALLPPELRGTFHACMKPKVEVERFGECMQAANAAATTPSMPSTSTTTTTHPPTSSTGSRSMLSPVERARADFRKQLEHLREKMRKKGVKSTSFDEAMADVVGFQEDEAASTTHTPATTTMPHARFRVKSAMSLDSLGSSRGATPSPVATMSQLILSFLQPNTSAADEDAILKAHRDLAEENRELRNLRSTRGRSNVQFFDIDVGRAGSVPELKAPDLPLTDETYNLVRSFSNSNSVKTHGAPSQQPRTPISLLSPKIASVLPDSHYEKGLLSPSIFALYENSREDQIMPIPKVLRQLGLRDDERKKVMEVALELAGARKSLALSKATTTEMPLQEYRKV